MLHHRLKFSLFIHGFPWTLGSLKLFFPAAISLCYINLMKECANYTLESESLTGVQTQIKAFMCLSEHNYTTDWVGTVHFNFHKELSGYPSDSLLAV